MRVLILAIILWLSPCGDTWGEGGNWCSGESRPAEPGCIFDAGRLDEPARASDSSTFRGISLASRPEDVRRIGQSLGYLVQTSFFVGDKTVASVSLCGDCRQLGQINFDREGHVVRLSLKDRFFCNRPIFVRRFAEAVFERYGVTPAKVDDDVCFQDVTCFKGVSRHGEQFLILRIGAEADLYVRRP